MLLLLILLGLTAGLSSSSAFEVHDERHPNRNRNMLLLSTSSDKRRGRQRITYFPWTVAHETQTTPRRQVAMQDIRKNGEDWHSYRQQLMVMIGAKGVDEKRLEWSTKASNNCSNSNSPVPLSREISLLQSGVLIRRGEYCHLQEDNTRRKEIQGTCQALGLTLSQGLIIRQQLLITKVLSNNYKLDRNLPLIHEKFCQQQCSLLDLSYEFDLPPVSLVRAVIKNRVTRAYPDLPERDHKRMVRFIIHERDEKLVQEFLSLWEFQELKTAKLWDVVSYQNDTTGHSGTVWEQALYDYLDQQGVQYLKENVLREKGLKITPDVLILDPNFRIEGKLVRWMDAKNFYGSGLKENWHFRKMLHKQVAKYQDEFGAPGAVVFQHGFSQKLVETSPNTLFLDAGPLATIRADSFSDH